MSYPKPLGNVIVLKKTKKTETSGGIALPDDFEEDGAKQAEVVGWGPKVSNYFTRNVTIGDKIVVREGFHAQKVVVDDIEFLAVPEDNVIAVIK